MSHLMRNKFTNTGIYAGYVFVTLLYAFPLLWVLSMSFKSVEDLFSVPPSLIPKEFMFENYAYVLERVNIFQYFLNSGKIVACTVIFTLLLAIPAAYALSRYKFKMKRVSLITILIVQMISPLILLVPIYRAILSLDLVNNFWAMIVVYVAVEVPFATWFMKGYIDTLPYELDEAATIDGCSRLQLIRKVLLPLMVPGLVSVGFLVAVQSWSHYLIPLTLINDPELFPISVGIANLQSTSDTISTHYLAAGCIIAILPVIILFIILQRYVVASLTGGAVKG
jgi:multiple sugar transport system permease protein